MHRIWAPSLVLAICASHARADSVEPSPPPRWPAYAGISVAIVGVATGTVAAFAAADQTERAREFYPTDPRYLAARDAFERDRAVAITAFTLAAAGLALTTYWSVTRLRVGAHVVDGGALLVFEHRR